MTEYRRRTFKVLVAKVDKNNLGVTAAFLADHGFPFTLSKSDCADYRRGYQNQGFGFTIAPNKKEGENTVSANHGQFIVIERGKLRVLDYNDFYDEFTAIEEAGSPVVTPEDDDLG